MEQYREPSSENISGHGGHDPSSAGDSPTRGEAVVVLGILLIGVASCLILYGRPIRAMLGIIWNAMFGSVDHP